MLLYSPSWLFLLPGGLLLLGLAAMLALAGGPVGVLGHTWQIHTMLGLVALTLIGASLVQLWVFARSSATGRVDEHVTLLERLGGIRRSSAASPGLQLDERVAPAPTRQSTR
jgi:hypothetical protein